MQSSRHHNNFLFTTEVWILPLYVVKFNTEYLKLDFLCSRSGNGRVRKSENTVVAKNSNFEDKDSNFFYELEPEIVIFRVRDHR